MSTIVVGDQAAGQVWWSVVNNMKIQFAAQYGKTNQGMTAWRFLSADAKVFLKFVAGQPVAFIYTSGGLVYITIMDVLSAVGDYPNADELPYQPLKGRLLFLNSPTPTQVENKYALGWGWGYSDDTALTSSSHYNGNSEAISWRNNFFNGVPPYYGKDISIAGKFGKLPDLVDPEWGYQFQFGGCCRIPNTKSFAVAWSTNDGVGAGYVWIRVYDYTISGDTLIFTEKSTLIITSPNGSCPSLTGFTNSTRKLIALHISQVVNEETIISFSADFTEYTLSTIYLGDSGDWKKVSTDNNDFSLMSGDYAHNGSCPIYLSKIEGITGEVSDKTLIYTYDATVYDWISIPPVSFFSKVNNIAIFSLLRTFGHSLFVFIIQGVVYTQVSSGTGSMGTLNYARTGDYMIITGDYYYTPDLQTTIFIDLKNKTHELSNGAIDTGYNSSVYPLGLISMT